MLCSPIRTSTKFNVEANHSNSALPRFHLFRCVFASKRQLCYALLPVSYTGFNFLTEPAVVIVRCRFSSLNFNLKTWQLRLIHGVNCTQTTRQRFKRLFHYSEHRPFIGIKRNSCVFLPVCPARPALGARIYNCAPSPVTCRQRLLVFRWDTCPPSVLCSGPSVDGVRVARL